MAMQQPRLLAPTAQIKPPGPNTPLYGVLRDVQDCDLDGVGAFGSAIEPKRLRDEANVEHDSALAEACQWAIDHHRPDLLAILDRIARADDLKDRHIARIDVLFSENTEADRQSIALIERLLSAPRETAKGRHP